MTSWDCFSNCWFQLAHLVFNSSSRGKDHPGPIPAPGLAAAFNSAARFSSFSFAESAIFF